MKKIFVTGVPGWLGNRFLEIAQAEKKYALKCLVLPGMDPASVRAAGAETVSGDIRDEASLKGAMEGCDYLVHLVGLIHPKKIRELYDVNTLGTENVLAEAARAGIKKMVHISSNSPAGFSRPGHLFTEKDPNNPYLNYGWSKLKAEEKVLEAGNSGKMETVILRPCWFYGPGQPERQTRFYRMIKKGGPLLFGDGSNLRSVSYVDSVVSAVLLALEKQGINREIFWIADERPYTMIEIYETVARVLGVEKLRFKKIPGVSSWFFEQADRVIQAAGLYQQEIHVAGEMARSIACSIEKAKRVLGYRPLTTFEEGVRKSIEWCRSRGIEI